MNEQSALKAHAYIMAACMRAHVKVESMRVKNLSDVCSGKNPTYTEEQVMKVIEEEGIGYNDIQSILYHLDI